MMIQRLRDAINPLLQAIHVHPFNQELAQGTLPPQVFYHYLKQDSIYLSDFSRALSITAAKLPSNDHTHQFIQFSLEALNAEKMLHASFIRDLEIANPSLRLLTIEQSPACFMYANYLLRMAAYASVSEAVASLLPCFLIYHEVGIAMEPKQAANNPYDAWISLYSSEEFQISVNAICDITNELAEQASLSEQDRMLNTFIRSSQLEWMFWESAYTQEKWPS